MPTAADEKTSIEWLSVDDIATLLTGLRRNPAAGRSTDEQGQFSLAGAQPKTTLYYDRGRWGVPKGRVPSTHIFKPPVLDLEDLAYNEHFCLHLARELGMSAATSKVERLVDSITGGHWRGVARAVEPPPQSLIDRVVERVWRSRSWVTSSAASTACSRSCNHSSPPSKHAADSRTFSPHHLPRPRPASSR